MGDEPTAGSSQPPPTTEPDSLKHSNRSRNLRCGHHGRWIASMPSVGDLPKEIQNALTLRSSHQRANGIFERTSAQYVLITAITTAGWYRELLSRSKDPLGPHRRTRLGLPPRSYFADDAVCGDLQRSDPRRPNTVFRREELHRQHFPKGTTGAADDGRSAKQHCYWLHLGGPSDQLVRLLDERHAGVVDEGDDPTRGAR